MADTLKQLLLWIPWREDPRYGLGGIFEKVPIQLTERQIKKVWTLYRYTDQNLPPPLPYLAVHNHNAWLEDFMHDWSIRQGQFHYGTRIMDRSVWVLIEYEDTQA